MARTAIAHYATPDFDQFQSMEQGIGWTDSRRARVRERLRALASEAVDAAFRALPQAAVDWHDERVAPGYYTAATIAEKQARVKSNIEVLQRWAGLWR